MSDASSLVAVLGGTFNPIHNGHLHSAKELKTVLGADELRFIPCHRPPHREQPDVSSQQRLAMVELALTGQEGLVVDDRELKRDQLSYTIDTLSCLRKELGDDVALCWVMGTDAVANIDSWHRWQEILDFAHVVVMARPGESLPETGAVAQWLAEHQVSSVIDVKTQKKGKVLLLNLTPYPVSSTEIRKKIQAGEAVEQLLPSSVLNYIQTHKLYQ